MSKIDTDIFLKSSAKDDINVSSSLFTTTTPSKLGNFIPDTTDSAYITKDIIKLHKKILDSDLIPELAQSETQSYSQSQSQHGGASSAIDTLDLPINYSESSFTDTSALRSAMKYAYGELIPDAGYSNSSSQSSSSSSSSSQTSSSSQSSSTSQSNSSSPKRVQRRTTPKKTAIKRKTSIKKSVTKTAPKKQTPKKRISKKTTPKETTKKTTPKKK